MGSFLDKHGDGVGSDTKDVFSSVRVTYDAVTEDAKQIQALVIESMMAQMAHGIRMMTATPGGDQDAAKRYDKGMKSIVEANALLIGRASNVEGCSIQAALLEAARAKLV